MLRRFLLLVSVICCVQTQDPPVRILDLKDVIIEDYHGPMNAKILALFENIENLTFQGCNFTTLHEDFAHPLKKLKKFVLAHSHFDRVKNDTSVCCKHLKDVELISSSMGPIAGEEFKKWAAMKNMERMYLHRMDVPALVANAWEGSNLKNLEIEFSNLETIEDGAFNGLDKLEVLSLNGNKLKTIPTKSLEALKNLKHLDLRRNHLDKINTEDFPVMPNLEKVKLGHNPVKEISLKGLKDKLPKLKEVEASGIDTDPIKNEGVPIVKVRIA